MAVPIIIIWQRIVTRLWSGLNAMAETFARSFIPVPTTFSMFHCSRSPSYLGRLRQLGDVRFMRRRVDSLLIEIQTNHSRTAIRALRRDPLYFTIMTLQFRLRRS